MIEEKSYCAKFFVLANLSVVFIEILCPVTACWFVEARLFFNTIHDLMEKLS